MKRSREREDAIAKRFSLAIDKHQLGAYLQEKDDPRFLTLYGMMSDPAYQRYSFSSLLRKAGISFLEIQQVYADGQRHLGLMAMMSHLPQVMVDVAEDAKNSTQPCPRCDALGVVPFNEKTRTCPLCEGATHIKRMGDRHARELLLETARLIRQPGTPLVAIQNNVRIDDSRIETMLKKTREITLERPARTAVVEDPGSGG